MVSLVGHPGWPDHPSRLRGQFIFRVMKRPAPSRPLPRCVACVWSSDAARGGTRTPASRPAKAVGELRHHPLPARMWNLDPRTHKQNSCNPRLMRCRVNSAVACDGRPARIRVQVERDGTVCLCHTLASAREGDLDLGRRLAPPRRGQGKAHHQLPTTDPRTARDRGAVTC